MYSLSFKGAGGFALAILAVALIAGFGLSEGLKALGVPRVWADPATALLAFCAAGAGIWYMVHKIEGRSKTILNTHTGEEIVVKGDAGHVGIWPTRHMPYVAVAIGIFVAVMCWWEERNDAPGQTTAEISQDQG